VCSAPASSGATKSTASCRRNWLVASPLPAHAAAAQTQGATQRKGIPAAARDLAPGGEKGGGLLRPGGGDPHRGGGCARHPDWREPRQGDQSEDQPVAARAVRPLSHRKGGTAGDDRGVD